MGVVIALDWQTEWGIHGCDRDLTGQRTVLDGRPFCPFEKGVVVDAEGGVCR